MPTFRQNPISFDRKGASIHVRMAGAAGISTAAGPLAAETAPTTAR